MNYGYIRVSTDNQRWLSAGRWYSIKSFGFCLWVECRNWNYNNAYARNIKKVVNLCG